MLPVEALIFDYDGTLSPVDAPREKAYPARELSDVLNRLSEKYLLGVATSKDYWFIRDRAPWATLLGLITGLEVIVGDYYVLNRDAAERGRHALLEKLVARYSWESCVFIELKKSITGWTLGASVDYRNCSEKPRNLEALLKESESMGLWTLRYRGHPFADIYLGKPDKSRVVDLAKSVLGVRRVYYFGDSENDVPAFKKADVKILVLHEYNTHMIDVLNFDYVVDLRDLHRWLSFEFLH